MEQPEEFYAYQLAENLGVRHPDELLAYLSATQFVGWMAFHSERDRRRKEDEARNR